MDQPLDLRLYLEYLRFDHLQPKDRPRLIVADLRKRWKVSDHSIREAKLRLRDAGLIRFESRRNKGLPDDVQIIDIWKRNAAHFKRVSSKPNAPEREVFENAPDKTKPNAPERESPRSTALDLTLQSVTSFSEKEIKNLEESNHTLSSLETEIWQAFLEHIREDLNPIYFETWFADLRPVLIQNERLEIEARRVSCDWIRSNYSPLLQAALNAAGIPAAEIVWRTHD